MRTSSRSNNVGPLPQRHALRLGTYDYARNGVYFVTICSQQRQCWFGEVVNDKMQFSEHGKEIEQCWLEIPTHFPQVLPDQFVIMPNHIHGLLVIDATFLVGARHASPVPTHEKKPNFGLALGTIIGSFKSAATKRINILRSSPTARVWQRGYYDHIVRNEQALHEIRRYIVDNPLQWALDKDNPNMYALPDGR